MVLMRIPLHIVSKVLNASNPCSLLFGHLAVFAAMGSLLGCAWGRIMYRFFMWHQRHWRRRYCGYFAMYTSTIINTGLLCIAMYMGW
jgi:hypothetical protein